jgi:hypothetical protein
MTSQLWSEQQHVHTYSKLVHPDDINPSRAYGREYGWLAIGRERQRLFAMVAA